MDGKEDKYEQLLAKIDWHAPHPPKGYQYGAGRGAKGFVTTAELTTVGATGAKMTREENDFFSAMERLEERSAKALKKIKADERNDEEDVRSGDTSSIAPGKVKLSLDDLATLELPSTGSFSSSAVKVNAKTDPSSSSTSLAATAEPVSGGAESSGVAAVPATQPPAPALVVRSARTEEGEAAEEHMFADERVLTPYDVLKGKVSAAQAGLQNVLAMGSTEEQTTWITHARAYREMGMTRRAYQTLVEGCAVTGKKGKRIWEERQRYLSRDNLAGRRRLLEEATSACPSEEELWTQLLEVVPPLERVPCLQRAVLACPTSEHLWLRLVRLVPSVQDQRVLLQKALQHTPHLPLLWARLARLESYKTGKEMFQAAAARFPSLPLVIEAAKYVEWYALSHWGENSTAVFPSDATKEMSALTPSQRLYAALRTADGEVGSLVRTAQQNYLNLGEAGSRHTWLTLALSLLRSDERELTAAAESKGEEAGNLTDAPSALATKPSVYVSTAAHMFLSVVDPNHKGLSSNAVPATWLSDLMALLPAEAATQHEVRSALWYTWILLLQQYVKSAFQTEKSSSGGASTASPSSSPPPPPLAVAAVSPASLNDSLGILEAAILSAPSAALQTELSRLLRCETRSVADREKSEKEGVVSNDNATVAKSNPAEQAAAGEEEEEEEELGKLAKVAPAATKVSTTATGAPAPSSAAAPVPNLPSALVVVVAATLGLTSQAAAVVNAAAHASSSPSITASSLPPSIHAVLELMLVSVPLTLSDALNRRGCCDAALTVVDLTLQLNTTASAPSAGVLGGVDAPTSMSSTSSLPEDTAPHSDAPARAPPQRDCALLLSDLRLHVARAKLLAAVGDVAAADRCLLEAINAASSHNARGEQHQNVNSKSTGSGSGSSAYHALQEETWVKLAVLRRSEGQPIDTILQDALRQCPRSWRLWLMLLEEKRRAIDAHQLQLRASLAAAKQPGSGASAAHISTVDMLRLDGTLSGEVRALRALCKTALSADHCRGVAAVWIFAAERIEAALLQNIPAARALLTDAASACAAAVHSTRSQLLARSLTPHELERQASALAQIGVAQAHLEAQHGTPGQALETVQEVLQRLPKTREGVFAMAQDDALGELLRLFIALEPPSSRGRAAAQVMRQWKSREPLALCAIAQLYYTAQQYAKALEQALKAVQASKGRCGDAVGLLWRMADQSVMHPFVRRHLYGKTSEEDDRDKVKSNTGGGEGEEGSKEGGSGLSGTKAGQDGDLSPAAVQQWVLSVMAASAATATSSTALLNRSEERGEGEESRTTPLSVPAALVVPNSGPLWVAVAKAEDPTNVTLRGYRRPVTEMLREVANRVELKGSGTNNDAAPLRS